MYSEGRQALGAVQKARVSRRHRTAARRAWLDAIVDGAAVLRHSSVSPATLKNYKAAVQHFENFCLRFRWSTSPRFVCATLERYFWYHADRGFDVALGRHTLYGWLHLKCPSKSVLANNLENAREAIAGWKKIHGETSRDPVPEEIHLAIVRQLLSDRRVLTAAVVYLHPQLYLRPSELIALRAEDVLLPVAGTRYRSIGVVVAPRELQITTKTKSQDDTVLVDGPCHASCGEVLRELVRIRAGGDRLFPALTLNSYEKSLRDVTRGMGIAELEIVPHTFRHSGPSNDLYHGRRSLQEIAKRGRWSNIKSVQRYSKSGRLLRAWKLVPADRRHAWTQRAASTGPLLVAALRRLRIGHAGS